LLVHRSLADYLSKELPGQLNVGGDVGRSSSFEITISGPDGVKKELFSKLKSGAFPDPASTLAAIKQFQQDGTIVPIAQAQGGGCSVQ
jgi:selT/selW/selH-like putative selenoprotein